MTLLIKFIRIYTPFICTLASLIGGLLFSEDSSGESSIYILATLSGSSILVTLYMFVTSLRMCIWFKLNLLCLFLIQLCGLGYNYFDIDTSLYVWVGSLFAGFGIIFFLIFKIFYKVTSLFLCIDRY